MPAAHALEVVQAPQAQGQAQVQGAEAEDRHEAPQWLCYVTFADVTDYEAKGWKVAGPLGGNHGHYSVLMIWEGQGEPN